MVIKNRLFPYPVLCNDTDDYVSGEFFVESSLVNQGINDMTVRFTVHLDNPGIRKLINSGKAEYILHVECSNTAFRTTIRTVSDTFEYRLMNSRVNGEISLLGMIVAKNKIDSYENDLLNEDYDGINISFDKASILAYDNMAPIRIKKNIEELSRQDSFFSVVKHIRTDENEQIPISFDITSDTIKISVDEDIYSSYIRYKGNRSMQPMMMALLVMPALTYMLESLRNLAYEEDEDSLDIYREKYWFIKLEKFYKDNNKDFVEDIILNSEDKMIATVVQEMLQLPIGKSMTNITEMLGE